MMARAYVETTIPSYLAAHPSRDIVIAGHQETTRQWWESARERFDLFVSETVVDEISEGDPDAAQRRRKVIEGLPVLEVDDAVRRLTRRYHDGLQLPEDAEADVVHIAFCVAYKMDYLVTWNCKHLANGEVVRRLMEINGEEGEFTPLMLTPDELLGGGPV